IRSARNSHDPTRASKDLCVWQANSKRSNSREAGPWSPCPAHIGLARAVDRRSGLVVSWVGLGLAGSCCFDRRRFGSHTARRNWHNAVRQIYGWLMALDLVVLGQDPLFGGGALAQTNAFLSGARELGREPELLFAPNPGLRGRGVTWRRIEALREVHAS